MFLFPFFFFFSSTLHLLISMNYFFFLILMGFSAKCSFTYDVYIESSRKMETKCV